MNTPQTNQMTILIQIKNLSKSHGAQVLFENAAISILENQKIGCIGRNGAGKSTLMRMVLGEEEADNGTIVQNGSLRSGYLEQNDTFLEGENVIDALMRRTGRPEWECARMAAQFHLKQDLLARPVAELAGGYRMRLRLSAMLLNEPNFLFLDEPTNYLDLNTQILLESFLRRFNGGYLLISHDREFLRRTCVHTLDVDNGGLFLYPGGIDEYLAFKQEDREQRIRRNQNIEARQKEIQSFVERFRAKASKAAQVQSRIKQLNRLEQEKQAELQESSNVRIRLPQVNRRSGVALRMESVSTGYRDLPVCRDIDCIVSRGEKIAVLGRNGEGKTTLLRTIAGEIPLLAGRIQKSDGLKVAYYAQHVYSTLSTDKRDSIYNVLTRMAAPDVSPQEIRDLGGAFLFSGDDIEKAVGVLSGGERARVCLAGILLSRPDVMLLDEPTNHLDFDTVESLGIALRDFSGAIIFVSHDRTFVNRVAERIIEVQNGTVRDYPGNYTEYVNSLQQIQENESQSTGDKGRVDSHGTNAETEPKTYKIRKEYGREARRLEKTLVELEQSLDNAELERQKLLDQVQSNPGEFAQKHSAQLTDLTEKIAELEAEWTVAQERLEVLQKAIADSR